MTPEEHCRLARELAAYEAKASARSVTYWLDVHELEGADRLAVLDLYKRGEEGVVARLVNDVLTLGESRR